MKNTVIAFATFAAWCILGLYGLSSRTCSQSGKSPEPVILRDTVTVRDTVYPPVPAPKIVTTVRRDTVTVNYKAAADVPDSVPKILSDSSTIVPVTENVYETEDYRAVIEGYRPRLVSMELYPVTKTITATSFVTRSPRWAITGGVGIGYTPGKGTDPYLGFSIGYVIWSK